MARTRRVPVNATLPVQHFRILALSKELRLMIYRLAIAQDAPIRIDRALKPPAITQVSRQIREESLDIYLNGRPFLFTIEKEHNLDLLRAWLGTVRQRLSSHLSLRKVIIKLPRESEGSDIFKVVWLAKRQAELQFCVYAHQQHHANFNRMKEHLQLSNVEIRGWDKTPAASVYEVKLEWTPLNRAQ